MKSTQEEVDPKLLIEALQKKIIEQEDRIDYWTTMALALIEEDEGYEA